VDTSIYLRQSGRHHTWMMDMWMTESNVSLALKSFLPRSDSLLFD
jgi:hypothetical protein